MTIRIIGYVLIGAALMIVVGVLYWNSTLRDKSLIFSPTQMLGATWRAYQSEYLEPDTLRTLDKQRDNITTSEGQSYTMLRAVWMGDKDIFDTSWQWTKDNLGRDDDHLFAWLFGKRADGSYGIISEEGGDQDIALALVFAYARWQDITYLHEARGIIQDLWDKEVLMIQDTPYLVANNYEKMSESEWAIINPSYLHPAAYKIFSLIDSTHPWNQLADSSYLLLERVLDDPLDKKESAGLPPDWIRIHKTTGSLAAPEEASLTTNFGYDALRTPLRIGLDWQWFGDTRAQKLLKKMHFLSEEWRTAQRLYAVYAHDGTPQESQETPAMYGGTIGYFMAADVPAAAEIYRGKLEFLFDSGESGWKETLSYYDDNIAWFGIGLYNNLLPNLAASIPTSFLSL